MRRMAVPTDDRKVRERLRAFGEPITLFGEGPGDRRDRLKIIQETYEREKGAPLDVDSSDSSDDDDDDDEFYTEGSQDLLRSRREIARYSLSRARRRLAKQRIEVNMPLSKIVNVRKEVFSNLKTFNVLGSQFGDDRPLSTIRFSPNSKLVLTTSWTGATKIWDLPNLNQVSVHKGHEEKISGGDWHPDATIGLSSEAVNFATGGGEGTVKLWSLDSEKPLASLEGHSARVGRVAFHPSGSFVGSAGFDGTWRLWDVATQKELLLQEGHSKEVIALAFQDDGALVSSAGFDGIGRVWDLRTGRTAMVLDGHAKEILSMDFAPNGFQLATGSGDNTIRIWDLRALKTQDTIPAHNSSVADLRFFRAAQENPFIPLDTPIDTTPMPGASAKANGASADDVSGDKPDKDDSKMDVDSTATGSPATPAAPSTELSRSGLFLVSAGFDGHVRAWSADEWRLVRDLATDAGKVMSADVSRDGKFIASASYSRSFHLFGGEHSLE